MAETANEHDSDAEPREKRIAVGQANTIVREDDNIADLYRRINDGMSGGLRIDMHHTALFHIEDMPDNGMPDLSDKVPEDLSTVSNGDNLETIRLRAADRPAYMEGDA